MTAAHDPDHLPHVRPLLEANDWASLARYWLAHQYTPALDDAIAIVTRQAENDPRRRELAAFLTDVQRDPLDLERQASESLFTDLPPKEKATVFVLLLDPRLTLCELAGQYAIEHQDQLYRIGLEASEQAVGMARLVEDPALEAFCRNVMASGYREVGDLEAARTSYQEALDSYRALAKQRPEVYRPDVAMTLNNLGNVQRALNDLEAARTSFQEAAQLHSADAERCASTHLVERRRCWNNLGWLYLSDAPHLDWPDRYLARDAFREARQCAEQFRGRFRDPRQRKRVQSEALHVYENLVGVSVDLWRIYVDRPALEEAVEVAEASRARNLMEMLAEEELSPADAPPDLVDQFRTWRRQLRSARERLDDENQRSSATVVAEDTEAATAMTRRLKAPSGGDAPRPAPLPKRPTVDVRRIFEETERSYLDVLGRLRVHDPAFDPDRPVAPITFAQARDLLPNDVPTALVQFTLTRQRGLAVILTRDDAFAVELPNLKDADAWKLANDWYRLYYNRDRNAWEAALPGLLDDVAKRALHPIMEKMEGRNLQRLILSPNRALHVFPLHACPLTDGRPLTDHVEVCYTPSLSILHRCAGRKRPQPTRLVLAENPTGDLAYTDLEGAGLRHLYPNLSVRRRRDVTREDLLRDAATSHILHYSGHASFDFEEPLNSALILGGQHPANRPDWLTLRDIFTRLHLRDNTLTILNGCESGMVRPEQVDEVIGLATGFLYAGSACVLSTLWAVYDLSSALLSLRFHELWQKGQTPASALRTASHWLRDIPSGAALRRDVLPDLLKRLDSDEQRDRCIKAAARYADDTPPFHSPSHWAPFTASGLAYQR